MRWAEVMVPFGLLVATVVCAPAVSADADTGPQPIVPGVVNYVEGAGSIGRQSLDAASIGTAQVHQGESLSTAGGRAEVLLTPGVFLRLDDQSSVEMVSASLSKTEVTLERGRALIEVDEIHSENDLLVTTSRVTARLLKTGLYEFDADGSLFRVVEGKASAMLGDRDETVTSGWQIGLRGNDAAVRAKFDMKSLKATDLYRWSDLRSQYLAEANVDAVDRFYSLDPYGPGWYGPGWYGAGWYWDPWASVYTFVPSGGIFSSTFGWRYYSPQFVPRFPARHMIDRAADAAPGLAWRPDHPMRHPGWPPRHGSGWAERHHEDGPRRW